MKLDQEKEFKPQVDDKSLYFGSNYLTPERMAAYYYQYSEITKLELYIIKRPRSLLGWNPLEPIPVLDVQSV